MAGPFVKLPRDLSLVGLIDRLNKQFQVQFSQAGSPGTVDPSIGEIVTSPLWFDPDNTFDIGLYVDGTGASDLRPASVYAGTKMRAPLFQADSQVTAPVGIFSTSVSAPLGSFSTRVTSPLLGTTTNANVVFDRNSVTQLTLSSLLATFAGAVGVPGYLALGTTPATAGDLRLEYGDSIQFRNQANTDNLPGFGVATAGVGTPNPTNNFFIGGVGANNLHFLVNDGTKWLMEAVSPYALLPWDNFGAGNTNRQDLGASTMRLRGGFFGTHLTVGASNTASVGAVRLASAGGIVSRNSTNTLDATLIAFNSSNHIEMYGLTASSLIFNPGGLGAKMTVTSAGNATFADDLTVTGDNLNVNGLTYTWPSSQSANRVLRNTGPGTLAWSQVDLSTDVTGALATGTVPLSQVTAGTSPAGTFIFPTLAASVGVDVVVGNVDTTKFPTSTNALRVGSGVVISGILDMVRYGSTITQTAYRAGGTLGAPTKTASGDVIFQVVGLGYEETTPGWVSGSKVRVSFVATENWTSTANGTRIHLWATPNGSTTVGIVMTAHGSGDVRIGSATSSPGLGAGWLTADGGLASAILDSGSATNLLLKRNAVTQLTLGSLAATFAGTVTGKRYFGSGTAHVAGDYTANASWGTTRSVSAVAATDTGGRVTITCNGASIVANPTVTLTFKDGTWTTIPAIVITRGDGTAPTTGFWALTTASATAPVFTFFGTPVAGSTYTFDFVVMGK